MLSIITVNLNNSFGLSETLSSLSKFKESKFEWIFIDGESKDESLNIALNFKRNGDVIISEPDYGIYNAMNKGIAKASGTHILFLNSGDIIHPNLNSLDEIELSNNNDLQLYGFEIRKKIRMPRNNCWRIWSMPTSHQAIVYSSKLLKQHQFNEEYRFAADFEHYLRINKNKLIISRKTIPIIINEPYGSDRNLPIVMKEYRKALINNDFPMIWAYAVFWIKTIYLKYILRL